MGVLSHPRGFSRWLKDSNCSCGSDKAKFDYVPDTIYGVSIRECCCVHDYRYSIGGDRTDKDKADQEFLYNMLKIIGSVDKWYYPSFLARRRALKYYEAVVKFGDSSFNWRKDENMA